MNGLLTGAVEVFGSWFKWKNRQADQQNTPEHVRRAVAVREAADKDRTARDLIAAQGGDSAALERIRKESAE